MTGRSASASSSGRRLILWLTSAATPDKQLNRLNLVCTSAAIEIMLLYEVLINASQYGSSVQLLALGSELFV